MIISARENNSSSSTFSAYFRGVLRRDNRGLTFIFSPSVRSRRWSVLPQPTMPSVLPVSSTPMNRDFHCPTGSTVGERDLPSESEHHGDSVFGGGDGVAERRIHNDDAASRSAVDVDNIDADPGAVDDFWFSGFRTSAVTLRLNLRQGRHIPDKAINSSGFMPVITSVSCAASDFTVRALRLSAIYWAFE